MNKINEKGYLGILTVIIISVITLTIATTIALLGINEMILGNEVNQSQRVLQLADGCSEEGYYRLKRNPSYSGGTIPFSTGSCTVSVSGSGSTRTITSSATRDDFTRTVTTNIIFDSNTSGDTEGVDLDDWDE